MVSKELEPLRNGFYRDVAVLASPTPENGARMTDLDERAMYVRAPYSSQPGVKPYLPVCSVPVRAYPEAAWPRCLQPTRRMVDI